MSERKSDVVVRACQVEDHTRWRELYDGYMTFYKSNLTDEIATTVWGWINDPDHDLTCIVAEYDGKVVGLAHYRRMLRPTMGGYIGYLDDLFVSPEARGLNVGDLFFEVLKEKCHENGWSMMRWLTADDNYRARSVYDHHSKKSHMQLYQMDIET